MTAPLTESEVSTARALSAMRPKKIGTLSSGEDVCFNERYLIEKDHRYLVEPSEEELAEIYRIIHRNNDLAPARGIMGGMLIGSAIWTAIGLVVYFTFFN